MSATLNLDFINVAAVHPPSKNLKNLFELWQLDVLFERNATGEPQACSVVAGESGMSRLPLFGHKISMWHEPGRATPMLATLRLGAFASFQLRTHDPRR